VSRAHLEPTGQRPGRHHRLRRAPRVVDTVLVGGRVVKRSGALVGVDHAELLRRLRASRDRVAAAAGVATDGTWVPGATG
jgi:5-methylthioadenosine/S-adenosylhomocysteine deaminase